MVWENSVKLNSNKWNYFEKQIEHFWAKKGVNRIWKTSVVKLLRYP